MHLISLLSTDKPLETRSGHLGQKAETQMNSHIGHRQVYPRCPPLMSRQGDRRDVCPSLAALSCKALSIASPLQLKGFCWRISG